MKRTVKRILAVLLTAVMLLSVAPMSVFAKENDYDVKKQTETSYEATSSVGKLITNELSETQSDKSAEAYFISDVTMNGSTAKVSLYCEDDCRVIVSAYDEKTGEMLTTGIADVEANAEKVTVSMKAAELPQYYLLKAFLVGENNQALCDSFATEHYTSKFEKFMDKDIFDFDSDSVLNLDEQSDTNFMVLADGTKTVTGNSSKNVLVNADVDNNKYEFNNIDNQITSLKPGDKFYLDNGDEENLTVIIVKSVSVSGTNATIIAEESQLEDLFDYIKIDTEQAGADFEINEDDPSDDFEYVRDIEVDEESDEGEITTQGVDIDKTKTIKKEFEIKKKEKKDKNDDKKFEYKVNKGTLTFQFDLSFKFYFADDYKEVSFVASPKITFEMSVEGTLNLLKFEMKEAKFKLCTGVTLAIKPTFVITLTGKLSLNFELTGAIGVGWDSNNGACNKSKPWKFKPSIELEVELYIGFDLKPELRLLHKTICNLKLTGDEGEGQIGFIITAKTYLLDPDRLDDYASHDCKKCISGEISFVLHFGLKLVFGEGTKIEFSDSWDIVNLKAKICDWHYSITYNDFGLCKCPYDHTGVTFGSYPQTQETNSSTINKLEKMSKNWKSYNYYTGTGEWYGGNMTSSDYMQYADIDTDNDGKNEYRAVKFTQYRPYRTNYTSSSLNSYQDENGYEPNKVYYFKYEPLTWRVLDTSNGLIMSEKIIDSQAYQNFIYYNGGNNYGGDYYNSKDCTNYASDWATSSIRKWLNEDFYNTAFTNNQKSKILPTHNENKSTYSSDYDSVDTEDNIFLLSYYDAINSAYGFNSNETTYDDTARQLKGTDYAKCQGVYVYNDSGSSYNGNSWWRLRSPSDSSEATGVGYDGWANDYYYSVYDTDIGVVPALCLNNLKSIISMSSLDSSTILEDEDSVVTSSVESKSVVSTEKVSLTLNTGKANFDGVSGNRYMLYSVDNGFNDLTLTRENLKYANQATAESGKTVMDYYPTDNTTTFVVGDFGSGIEAKKVEFKTGYTVTWNIDGKTVTEIYAAGDKLTPPTVPSKSGYTFKGWDKSIPSTMPANDLTFTAVYEKNVEKKNVKSVSIDDISLNYKKSTTLKPTIKADDGAKYKVEYSTSNAKVATVDKNGKVTATKRGSGTATITCTVTDSNGNVVKDTCKVSVKLSFGQILIVYVLFGWIWY